MLLVPAERGDSLDSAQSVSARDEHDVVDRLRNEIVRHVHGCLPDELFESGKTRQRRVRVKGRDSARMTGIPGLQHVERFGSAYFADNDPVGSKAQGRAHKVRQVD